MTPLRRPLPGRSELDELGVGDELVGERVDRVSGQPVPGDLREALDDVTAVEDRLVAAVRPSERRSSRNRRTFSSSVKIPGPSTRSRTFPRASEP